MKLLFSNSAGEQVLLDLIDNVMDIITKEEAIAAKKSARLASKALLDLKRSRSPPPKTKASADSGSPIQKKLKTGRKSITAETQLAAVLWVNTNRPASKHRDWYPLLVACPLVSGGGARARRGGLAGFDNFITRTLQAAIRYPAPIGCRAAARGARRLQQHHDHPHLVGRR